MKNNTNELKNIGTIKANAEIFIIPNSAAKISGYFEIFREKYRNLANKICKDNNLEFNENKDYMVETWICSDDLRTENLADHGCKIMVDGKKYYLENGAIKRDIPSTVLYNLKEGESITLIFNDIKIVDYDSDDYDEYLINLELNITASQTKYRYARFGKFEDVLKYVCR